MAYFYGFISNERMMLVLPEIWIFDTYTICILIGVITCLFVFENYAKKKRVTVKERTAYEVSALISIVIGIISAMLFQYLYNILENPQATFDFSMTFLGGLVGGIICFLLLYRFYIKARFPATTFSMICTIAPPCICLAHGWGRIGCFMAGCCYGIQTDSFLGVQFPDLPYKVYPTQLYEAAFLFFLFILLLLLAEKQKGTYNLIIYLVSYGLFRFFIEFIRGDDRGFFFLHLSPSQWLSLLMILASGVLLILTIKRKKFN